jgi:N-acyl-phosphatidylethanolamine-hydrolysing phospholipase D
MSQKKTHHTPRGYRNNYVASVTRPLRDVLRWQWQRRRDGLPRPPRVATPRVAPEIAFLVENAIAGARMMPTVTWIGHATTLVQAGGLSILTDPIFSHRASPLSFLGPQRAHAPGIAIIDLPRIDVVVVSHNHYDHLDRRSIETLARQHGGPPLFLVPLGIKKWLGGLRISRAVELDWWDHYEHEDVEFHFTPAQHWSARSLTDRNRTLWGAWSVLGADLHWFFSGDTGYSADFNDTRERFAARQTAARGGGFDVALIAVGACEPRWFMRPQHVDPAEAVQIHLDLRAKRSIGIHWGTFSLADEPLDHAIDALAAARVQAGVAESSFFLTALGETRRLPARTGGMTEADGTPTAATVTAAPGAADPEGPARRP